MKVDRLPDRILTPNSYAIQGGGLCVAVTRDRMGSRYITGQRLEAECKSTLLKNANLLGAKGSYREYLF
jgi:hypothetical protein